MSDDEHAADLGFADLPEGTRRERVYTITEAVYAGFLAAFDDRSPVHVDEAYARAAGFEGRVMHGAILGGFVSHFVGMVCPGRRALLLSTDLRFAKPSYLGDAIALVATVTQAVESQRVVVLTIEAHNRTRGWIAARGRVQAMVRDA